MSMKDAVCLMSMEEAVTSCPHLIFLMLTRDVMLSYVK